MEKTVRHRQISSIQDEGFGFNLVLQYVAHFYVNIMRGQVRRDGPQTLIKHSRDWEYPWTLIKSEIKPGYKILDCGAGYSPLPFIWAANGAEVYAVDRDAVILSAPVYALRCLGGIMADIGRFPAAIYRRALKKEGPGGIQAGSKDKSAMPADRKETGLTSGILSSLYSRLVNRHLIPMRRIWRPDFWGPVSPRLLKKYGVTYRNGDITRLPYPDDYFDVVSCISVLEHMPEDSRRDSIQEMARTVKRGGRLIITYDKHNEDLTGMLAAESGMRLEESAHFIRPQNLYKKGSSDVMGVCLVK